jgi:hypothetical protein
MTVDKICHYVGKDLYEHWTSVNDAEIIKKAYDRLNYELENNILPNEIKYHAELKLLKIKLGI